MAILPIITAPDARLKAISAPVGEVDDALRRLMDDMLQTMYAAPGVGLSAVQVGVAKRVIVVDISRPGEPRAPLRLVNPETVSVSEETASHEEGCLSLPEHYAEVVRPIMADIRYQDENGEACELHIEGLLATCVLHELDHLDGILFVDHISVVRRHMILRKLLKARKSGTQKKSA